MGKRMTESAADLRESRKIINCYENKRERKRQRGTLGWEKVT